MKRLIIIFQLLVGYQTVVSQDGKLPIIDVHMHSRPNRKGMKREKLYPDPVSPNLVKKFRQLLRGTRISIFNSRLKT
jgi:hypothetical protein